MTPSEIIRAHAKNQGIDENILAGQIHDFLAKPKTHVFQQNDCLFLTKDEHGVGFFYIVNGGSAPRYIRAIRMFIDLMKKMGYKQIAMRIEDKQQSQKMATAVGVRSVSYKTIGGKHDPYLMTMEI